MEDGQMNSQTWIAREYIAWIVEASFMVQWILQAPNKLKRKIFVCLGAAINLPSFWSSLLTKVHSCPSMLIFNTSFPTGDVARIFPVVCVDYVISGKIEQLDFIGLLNIKKEKPFLKFGISACLDRI